MKKLFVILTALSFSYAGYSQTWLEHGMNGMNYGTTPPNAPSAANDYSEPTDDSWRLGETGIGTVGWPETWLHANNNSSAANTAASGFLAGSGGVYGDFTAAFTNGGTTGRAFAGSSFLYTSRSSVSSGINFGQLAVAQGDGMNNNMGVLAMANGSNNYEIFGVQGIAEGNNNTRNVGVYGIGFGDGQTWANFGVFAQCNTTDVNSANVGVRGRGVEGTETALVSIGVHGLADCDGNGGGGTQFNCGVYGQIGLCSGGSGSSSSYTSLSGSYAGYFDGDVYINGTGLLPSDMRLKENIKPLQSITEKLSKVNVYTYTFKQDNGLMLSRGTKFGVLSQELERQFPELVRDINVLNHKDPNSYKNIESIKAVDYFSFIPLLIQSVKELNEKIETLDPEKSSAALAEVKRKVADIQGALNQTTGTDEGATDFIVAYPNPSNTDMTISIKRNTACTNCVLVVSDLAGKSIKQYRVDGNNQDVTLSAKEFGSGVFQCSLVTNGKVVSGVRIAFTE